MNEKEKQFCAELKALLEKHKVELSSDEDGRVTAFADVVLKDFEIVHEGIDINFGHYIDGGNIQVS